MPGIKTAISLEKNIFEQVNKLARDMRVSRSRLFTLAVKDYLKKQESQSLLARLNEAYDDYPNDEERKISKSMRSKQRKITGQESW